MARSFKDDSAFNNWERDIKNISSSRAPKETQTLGPNTYRRYVEEALGDRLGSPIEAPKVQGFIRRAKNHIEEAYKTLKDVNIVAKEIEIKFPEDNFGFSHAQAHLWIDKDGKTGGLPAIEKPKKTRKKKELNTETQAGEAA